ncbi:MAG: ExeM/NucH family extracellular endonuclease [Anaerolineae bacterium]|nr:ExeM/NucH family extracellular endonuclease [Anaerolineae bacterium]
MHRRLILSLLLSLVLVPGAQGGATNASPGAPATGSVTGILINEVDADTAGADTLEFVELYDGGSGGTDLSGLAVVFYNGNTDSSYAAFDLDGCATDVDGYFVLGNAALPAADLTFPDNTLQNGADAVALYLADSAAFPTGAPVTTTDLLDALVYDTSDSDDPGLLVLLNADQPQVNESGGGNSAAHSNQRCPNGEGGQRNTSAYTQAPPTPGTDNACAPPFGACGDPATLISAVQGTTDASPFAGSTGVILEGVVVGDWQATSIAGFYLQEDDADVDPDPATSEGIFVYGTAFPVSEGDLVRVQGAVSEYYGLTEITGVTNLLVCSTGMTVTPGVVTLPLPDATYLERFEGMQVSLPQTLTLSDNYQLGRYGEVVLSLGRLMAPTSVVTPGAPANALQTANDLDRLILDDDSLWQNPEPIVYPPPELSAGNTLRAGDTASGIVGVLSYSWSGYPGTNAYRIHPTAPPTWQRANPRPAQPAPRSDHVRVAALNILNFFNGDGSGGGFPTARGATTYQEFLRQRDKLVAALAGLGADVIGLVEVENDGYGPSSALQELTDQLNLASPVGTSYAFVDPGFGLGTDEIVVALLYRTETISLSGSAATTDTTPFSLYRLPLAQTFEARATGARFTVVVNHFKSKGCSGASGLDEDQGDGQSCYNATRVQMSEVLIDWLATDPTGSGDPDFLIVGDLNAYAMEDPITVLETAGYADLVERHVGTDAYSYAFYGQAGYLDHALGSGSLAAQVAGAQVWHINADEPSVLDYNTEYKSPDQQTDLYAADAYRSSDHDPVIVDLAIGLERIYLPLVRRD